jgi:uncharacterized membrane protein YkvA (DUF1232 family)
VTHYRARDVVTQWKARARALKFELYALYLACRDPRVPWYAKAATGCVVAYAFSPIDLIPDFVPILGYVDDLILVPLGVLAVRRMIPPAVLDDCRARATVQMASGRPTSWTAAAVIVALWLGTAIAVAAWWLRSN